MSLGEKRLVNRAEIAGASATVRNVGRGPIFRRTLQPGHYAAMRGTSANIGQTSLVESRQRPLDPTSDRITTNLSAILASLGYSSQINMSAVS